jgi:ParB family transcriptional regulator, chromosome partitioning protein
MPDMNGEVTLKDALSTMLSSGKPHYDTKNERLIKIDINKIYPDPNQPRKLFKEDLLDSLVESIRREGVVVPIHVMRVSEGGYQIIAGERRYRAAKEADLDEIPAIIFENKTKHQLQIHAMIENVTREDLNAIEEAEGYKVLIDHYNMTHEDLAKKVGKSRPNITNLMRLTQLDQYVKDLIVSGQLSKGQGRALVVLSVEEQVEIANIAIERRFNTRQVEDLVNRRIRGEEEKPKPLVFKTNNYLSEKYSAHLSKFSAHSNTNLKVKIQEQGDRRKLTIDFETEEDLDIFVQGERPD